MTQGPPTKPHRLFTTDVLNAIVEHVSQGNYKGAAARAQGVTRSVWDQWLRWGNAGIEPYAEFVGRVESAEAAAHVYFVALMKKAAAGDNVVVLHDADGREVGVRTVGDWRAAAWWLSRKFAHDWSEKATLQQAAETAIQQEEIELSIPLLEQYLSKLGYRLLPMAEEPGRDTELNNGTKQKGRSKRRSG